MNEKLVAILELPAKQQSQSSPFTSKLGQIGQIGSAVSRSVNFRMNLRSHHFSQNTNEKLWKA
jgi:hypothetical protein